MNGHCFIPTFTANGRRWRVRLRLTGKWGWWRDVARYPHGEVYRVKAGPLLVVAMAD